MFLADVFDQIVEPYVNLLITNISTIDCKVLTSKLSFTRFIWHNFLIHDEVKLEMCSLYDKFESNVVPRSLADVTGFHLHVKISQRVNKMCSRCLFPVVDKSGTSCYHLVTRLTRPTDSQQVVPTSLISSARNKLLTS